MDTLYQNPEAFSCCKLGRWHSVDWDSFVAVFAQEDDDDVEEIKSSLEFAG